MKNNNEHAQHTTISSSRNRWEKTDVVLTFLLYPKCWLFSIPRCLLSPYLDNTLLSW